MQFDESNNFKKCRSELSIDKQNTLSKKLKEEPYIENIDDSDFEAD
jgi:hypothetical protein